MRIRIETEGVREAVVRSPPHRPPLHRRSPVPLPPEGEDGFS